MPTVNTAQAIGPIVSIGLPVHNGGESLARALDSILAQTYTNFQLVISDNASTDRTAEICLEYSRRDSRIRYFRQPKNIGATANFRYVLESSTQLRFIWAAADDWWDQNRLELLVAELHEQDAAVVGTIKRWSGETAFAEFKPIAFHQGEWWHYFMREESRCEKVYYIYGLLWRDSAIKALASAQDRYCDDAFFCYQLLWGGNLRSVDGATLNVSASLTSSGGLAAESFRYSFTRLAYKAHPWSFYKGYYLSTPSHARPRLVSAIPLKALCSQLHLWFRAFRRVILKRPYVHGALPGGENVVRNSGL